MLSDVGAVVCVCRLIVREIGMTVFLLEAFIEPGTPGNAAFDVDA